MNLHKLQEKRVFYILAGTLIILVILFATLLFRQKKVQDNSQSTLENSPRLTVLPLPVTNFANYTLNTDLPALPSTVKLADLKGNFTTGEALDLATKIGFNNSLVNDGEGIVMVTDQDEAAGQQGLLSINKTTGSFVIVSKNGYPTGGSDPTSAAQAFLQKMGLWDDTMIVSATYKRASYPGYTFVEIHRSWDKLGLPLVNPLGVLNLTESEKLADVKLGYIESTAPDDPDIVESSDGAVGKIRPNQFNTITIGITDENNNVMSATSNLKLLAKSEQRPTGQSLKTPEEALEDLKNGKTSFSLAKPTGEGAIEIQNVFPDNKVDLQDAVINEVMLTYIDEFGQKSQSTTLQPFYLFRGTAVSSGYNVQFVQTVAAVKQTNTLGVFAQTVEPTVFQGQGSSLQYGTFNWLTPAPHAEACAGLTNIFQLPNGGYIGWYPNVKPRSWYYVPPAGQTIDQGILSQAESQFRAMAKSACQASLNDPSVCGFDETQTLQTACYFLTTASPFIFIYSNEGRDMQISLPRSVTYADPPFSSNNTWAFTTSVTNKKFYYEYDKKVLASVKSSLKSSSEGFLVDKNKLSEFSNLIAGKLGLNPEEKSGLSLEMSREARKLAGDKLKVGLLDRNTVDELLPLTVTPQPESSNRLIFYLTTARGDENLKPPTLKKVSRIEGLVLVEVGAVGL